MINPIAYYKAVRLLNEIAKWSQGKGTSSATEILRQASTLPLDLGFKIPANLSPSELEAYAEASLGQVEAAIKQYLQRASWFKAVEENLKILFPEKEEDIETKKSDKAAKKEVPEEKTQEKDKQLNHYKTLGVDQKATEEEIRTAYAEKMKNKDQMSNEEIEEIDLAYKTLIDPRYRKTYDKQLNFLTKKDLQAQQDIQDKGYDVLVISTKPQSTQKTQEQDYAKRTTAIFRQDLALAGKILFNEDEINALKNIGVVPNQYTPDQASESLNIAATLFARGVDPLELADKIDQLSEKGVINSNQTEHLSTITKILAFLKISNRNAADNLRTALGNPVVEIEKAKTTDTSNFDSHTILIKSTPESFSQIRPSATIQLAKESAVKIKNFILKSLQSHVVKKSAQMVNKISKKLAYKALKFVISKIVDISLASTGYGTILVVLKYALSVILKIARAIVKKISDFIRENKTASSYLLLLGATAFSAAFMAGVTGAAILPVLGITIGSVIIITAIVVVSGWILLSVLGFILFTVFVLLITNSAGYVIPPLFEQGTGSFFPSDCLGAPPPIPSADPLKISFDGKFAFPVGQFQVPGYSYYHWDKNKAADIFSPLIRPPIVAVEDGTIGFVVLNDSKGGKYIKLKGKSGRWYYYAHLCHVFVKPGQSVKMGQVIGIMDETGSGRVQHLHFAINKNSSYFYGGDGDICPQSDFEEKFGFGICTDEIGTNKPICCVKK